MIATTACRPHGRVRLLGETWQARCSDGAVPAEALVVREEEGYFAYHRSALTS